MWFSKEFKLGGGGEPQRRIILVICEKCGRAQLAVVNVEILPRIEGVRCDLCHAKIERIASPDADSKSQE